MKHGIVLVLSETVVHVIVIVSAITQDASNTLHVLILGEKSVFIAALNFSSLSVESQRLSGRELQVIGLTTENARGPNLLRRCCGTMSW